MPRTDVATVRETIDTSLSDSAIQDWIAAASDLVDDIDESAVAVDDDRLIRIETLVAQHFLSSQDPRVTSQSADSMSLQFGEGRQGNDYLDRALMLDPSGVLQTALEADTVVVSTTDL